MSRTVKSNNKSLSGERSTRYSTTATTRLPKSFRRPVISNAARTLLPVARGGFGLIKSLPSALKYESGTIVAEELIM